jgi:iron-sulfur cluster repair protein YtfE (RIC family)
VTDDERRLPMPTQDPAETIRAEHHQYTAEIEQLRRTADMIDVVPLSSTLASVRERLAFLERTLLPHATAEARVVYPKLDQIMEAKVSGPMTREHVEIARLTRELAREAAGLQLRPAPESVKEVRAILYGLHALLTVHFAREEETYLPLLRGKLDAAETVELTGEFEAARRSARAGG